MKVEAGPEDKFREFFRSFQTETGDYKYRKRLAQAAIAEAQSIIVDFEDLISFDPVLSREVTAKPEEYLEQANRAAWAQMKIEDPEYAEQVKRLLARFRRIPDKTQLRKIGSEHVGTLIIMDGIIVRSTQVKPLITRSAFQCRKCHKVINLDQTGNLMKRVTLCPYCRSKFPDFVEKLSTFINYQELRVQERPEDLPPGQLPRSLDVNLTEDLVDIARPGDRVSITGIVRARQEMIGSKGKLRSFELLMDANYVDVVGKEAEVIEISPEDENRIIELSKDPWIHRKLLMSLAPSIYGYADIKEALLYLLFGGTRKTLPDGVTIRGDVNILLVGDPGTAKSALLQYVSRTAPRGLYTSGRGSTAAGLTAAVLREKTGGMVLEAGALVLADKGVASIDEIDKMRPDDRVAIHEAMEQQSYHPSFEIMLANGEKTRIGKYVDRLFREHGAEKIIGKDCEILPVRDYGIRLITTCDFERFETAPVDRVSRHVAPRSFLQIHYSNGRDVVVTPDHPVFVCRDGKLCTVAASEIRVGDFVPGPRTLECMSSYHQLVAPLVMHHNEKIVTLPSCMTEDLANIMGYLITEGYSCRGSASEIGFANTTQTYIREMNQLMRDTFDIVPLDYSRVARTQRYVSSRLYRYFEKNFPIMLEHALAKRVPEAIMNAPPSIVRAFLRTAFKGDGSVEPQALCYRTSSRGLAEDYQDLLLRLGISSRLLRDGYNNSLKVYIMGDSIPTFVHQLVDRRDSRFRKIQLLLKKSCQTLRGHDILPTDVAWRMIALQRLVGISNDGYFHQHLRHGYGITRRILGRRLRRVEARITHLRRGIIGKQTIRSLRQLLEWSQTGAAKKLRLRRGTIDYAERNGYDQQHRRIILEKMRRSALDSIASATFELRRLKALNESNIRWLRVTKVQTLQNKGSMRTRWVYDLTVEPTHNFVSQGVVLHNTVSVAKGGIVATLNARASVLAAANPALGRYDAYKLIAENINLPVTILSRFDLIFVVRDVPDVDLDAKMSEHIMTLHRKGVVPVEIPLMQDLLRKYISFAKRVEPILSEEAERELREFYLKMRSVSGSSSDSPIAITPRQLEALVRLSEARARVFLRDKVSVEDARAVIRLMNASLQDVGIDTTTGKTDIDIIMTGKSKSLRDAMALVRTAIADLEKETGSVEETELYKTLSEKSGIDEDLTKKVVSQLLKEGLIYSPKPGHLKRTSS